MAKIIANLLIYFKFCANYFITLKNILYIVKIIANRLIICQKIKIILIKNLITNFSNIKIIKDKSDIQNNI